MHVFGRVERETHRHMCARGLGAGGPDGGVGVAHDVGRDCARCGCITQHTTHPQTRARQNRWTIKQFPVESVWHHEASFADAVKNVHVSRHTGTGATTIRPKE